MLPPITEPAPGIHLTDTALYLIDNVEKFVGNQGIRAGSLEVEYTIFNRYNEATVIGLLAMKHAIYADDMKIVEALVEHGLPLNSSVNRVYRGLKRANIEGFHELLARNGVIEDGKIHRKYPGPVYGTEHDGGKRC